MLNLIKRELEASSDETRKIPKEEVLLWMQHKDPDVLGAIYGLLHSVHLKRIQPALNSDELFDFLFTYYKFCLETDPDSEWANGRYLGGHPKPAMCGQFKTGHRKLA
jgi:hypothetical protein